MASWFWPNYRIGVGPTTVLLHSNRQNRALACRIGDERFYHILMTWFYSRCLWRDMGWANGTVETRVGGNEESGTHSALQLSNNLDASMKGGSQAPTPARDT